MKLRSKIDSFLAQKRFAMVGVSRREKDFSRALFREFCNQGYDVVPVNPGATEIEGRACYPAVKDVPGVKSALLMTAPNLTPAVVEDCAAAGLDMVWMFRNVEPAVELCQSRGMEVIAGQCPFMFLPEQQFIHRCHAGLLKIFGRYPVA